MKIIGLEIQKHFVNLIRCYFEYLWDSKCLCLDIHLCIKNNKTSNNIKGLQKVVKVLAEPHFIIYFIFKSIRIYLGLNKEF
jgi:hypothetical protein